MESEEASRGMSAREYKLILLTACIITWASLASGNPWIVAFPIVTAGLATFLRLRTVRAIEARERGE